jgi:hypothetical protein
MLRKYIKIIKVFYYMTSSYYDKIHNDAEFYAKEKKRIAEYMKNRYNTDELYREKKKEYARIKMKELYYRKKLIS